MGNHFDDQSTKRISAVVRDVESQGVSNLPPIQKHPADGQFLWFVLVEDFDASTHEAEAEPRNWTASANSGAGEYRPDPAVRYTVRDTTEQSGASEGSWVLCRPIGTENGTVWEPITVTGGTLFAKLDATLNAGSSCEASIWSGDPLADSGANETVYDWFLESGMKLVSGVKVMLTMISGKWYVTQSNTCSVDQ